MDSSPDDLDRGELWRQAGGGTTEYSPDRYRALLVAYGHLIPIPGPPGPLPCGWPSKEPS